MSRRTATRPEVRVGGFWLSSIAPQGWGQLEHSTRTNGSWQASWTIPIVRTWRHPALVYGAKVEVFLGPICIWSGTLEEPNWDSGEFIALGASRDGEDAVAIDGSGNSSTNPNAVIDAAIARGVLSWTRVGDFGTTSVGQSNDGGGLVTIRSVLDAWAQENASRWVVNESRQLIAAPVDETRPTWHAMPGSGVLGSAAEERVDRVFVRYLDPTTGRRATASYPATTPASGIERPVDITDRGAKTPAQAASIAQDIWSDLQGRSGWTNGITLARGQATTPGGTEVDLALVRAGDTLRLLGVPDVRGVAQNTDVVIGDTDYNWEDDELQANPVGLAARDDTSVLEQVGNLAVDAAARAGGSGSGVTPFAIAVGETLVAVTAAVSGNAAITFPAGRFTAAPKVQATVQDAPSGSQTFVARVINATTTGASIYIYTGNNATATATVKVAWEAIQMTSTSAVG